MVKWLNNPFRRIINKFDQFRGHVRERAYQDTLEARDLFMRELRARQPVGQDDPLADAARRPRRPSIRQGNIPIELGWHSSVIRTNWGAQIEVNSESPHLKYFTLWMGRDYLGTRATGRGQVARNARVLAFWWRGRAHFPKAVRAHGFNVETDFVQDAYDAVEPEISRRGMRSLRNISLEMFR